MLKYGGTALHRKLHKIIKQIWKDKQIPAEWHEASIVPIFKKGDRTDTNNYRGIALLCTGSTVLPHIIKERLSKALEPNLHECQCDFRPGRSTNDMIFAARQLAEKSREHRNPLYWCFVDFHKAYDCVNRDYMWRTLEQAGVPETMLEVIKNMHSQMVLRVQVNGRRKECVLSPLLFNVCLDVVTRQALADQQGVHIKVGDKSRGQLTEPIPKTEATGIVNGLQYADDIALVAENEDNLQTLLVDWITSQDAQDLK